MAGRLNALAAGLLVFAVVAILLFITLPEFFLNWNRALNGHLYVKATGWDLPSLFAIPVLVLAGIALLLKAFNRSPEKISAKLLRITVIWMLICFAVKFIYGSFVLIYLSMAGYSKCLTLSDPSLYARSVWVKEDFICVANAGHVRDELIDGFDELITEGGELTADTVQKIYKEVDALWNYKI